MPLSKKEIDALVRLVALTQDEEIDCEQCLAVVAEFAEKQLEGMDIADGLKGVQHHLEICSECQEEYQALLAVLKQER